MKLQSLNLRIFQLLNLLLVEDVGLKMERTSNFYMILLKHLVLKIVQLVHLEQQ